MRRFHMAALNAPRDADQAAQEAGTATLAYVSPDNQQHHRSASKAGGQILLSGTTPVLATGYNIGTVSGPASGMINVAFTNQMASAFYWITANPITTSGSTQAICQLGSMTTASFVVWVKNGNTGALTTNYIGINVQVFGLLA